MITDKKEKQVLLNLRGMALRSKDGMTVSKVLTTDTETGTITLGDGERTDLVSVCILYDVPETVFDV